METFLYIVLGFMIAFYIYHPAVFKQHVDSIKKNISALINACRSKKAPAEEVTKEPEN